MHAHHGSWQRLQVQHVTYGGSSLFPTGLIPHSPNLHLTSPEAFAVWHVTLCSFLHDSALLRHKGTSFKPSGLLDLLPDVLLTVLCFL